MGELIDLGKAREKKKEVKAGFLMVECPECNERMKYSPDRGWVCSKCGHSGV